MLFQPTFKGGDMDWYFITYQDGVEASESQDTIKVVFLKYFTTSGVKEGMGVFLRREILNQTTTFYFTPAAASVGKMFGAFKCEQPPRLGITLFAGPDTCWNLFPEMD